MRIWLGGLLAAALPLAAVSAEETGAKPGQGSVIFMHIDGAGMAHWQAARYLQAGPDGEINWDRLPHLAVYRGHVEDTLTPSSNAAATVHAFGVKVPHASFGTDSSGKPPLAPSGQRLSLMQEARARGIAVGVVNSGSAIEPGTACHLTSVHARKDEAEIVAQQLASGADVILAGGEEWYLPEGVSGRHGEGRRKDGRNLVEEAVASGYRVVFTREELVALPDDAGRVLGIFAHQDTFNDEPEHKLAVLDVPILREVTRAALRILGGWRLLEHLLVAQAPPLYAPDAPTLAEMTRAALRFLGGRQFFLVVEEEGVDNFGNCNNAPGTMEALRRGDEALGTALEFIESHPETLLVTFGDSEAGNMDVIGLRGAKDEVWMLAAGRDENGAPVAGARNEAGGGVAQPFVSRPDRAGRSHRFVVSWGTRLDSSGGILVRAAGLDAGRVAGTMDNTDFYPLFRETLFGENASGR